MMNVLIVITKHSWIFQYHHYEAQILQISIFISTTAVTIQNY